jgi:hypothetical protein
MLQNMPKGAFSFKSDDRRTPVIHCRFWTTGPDYRRDLILRAAKVFF